MAVILILVATGIVAIVTLFGSNSAVERSTKTTSHLASIESALEQFASSSDRLPCPADPALDTGDEARGAGAAVCVIPTGTVPWRTIGLRRDDSLDAWGWKISYRVYTGAAGSLTQDGGASMVDCDTNEALSGGATPRVGSAGGLCQPQPAQNTRTSDFLTGKGLSVNDFGVAVTDAAYVLISHGPSGLGAFTSSGQQKPLPMGDELTNVNNVTPIVPYVARAASPAGTAPESAVHFDDVLAYRKLGEFVKRANLAARDWPDSVLASVRFDGPSMSAAAGAPVTYGDVGRQSLNFYNSRVTAFDAGGNQNLTFDQAGGNEGIGGLSGGATSLSSATGEGIRIELTQTPKAGKYAVTLNDFGTISAGTGVERAEFKFFDGATLRSTVVKLGCNPDGGLASFTIDAGGDFDIVEIRAMDTVDTMGNPFPSSPFSLFFVSEFRACLAGATCETSLQTPGNTCP